MATKSASKTGKRQPPARKTAGKTVPRRPARADAAPRERTGLMELGGKPATIVGDDVQVGQAAPRFRAQVGVWPGFDTWHELDPLAATAGDVRILAAVPSLDTNTCDLETRRFNQEAAALGDGIRIITISTDLPVAQKRWCGAAGVDKVVVVSDHMATEFGIKYGTLMKERRWLRRAVFVVAPDGTIAYAAYLPRLSEQPDYAAVLEAARRMLPPEKRAPKPASKKGRS
jgi:thiol peroxidase